MGKLTDLAGIFSPIVSVITSINDQKKARREARSYKAQLGAEQQRAASAQAKIDRQLSASQKRTALGLARARRPASNRGLFGDSTINSGPTSPTLG